MKKLTKFHASDYLDSEEAIAEYLTAALEDENPDAFLAAISDVAKTRGMASIAKSTGLGRESLYKALAPGAKPRYDTVLKILRTLGLKHSFKTHNYGEIDDMYKSLPADLLEHIHPKLYFPYFGSLVTATHATFGINCGPPEFEHDSLGLKASDWTVTSDAASTKDLIKAPNLTIRPSYYFKYGQPGTPTGLGRKQIGGFWSFFNCGTKPDENPFHREHYFDGALVHIDAVPWATLKRWSGVPTLVQNRLIELSLPLFEKTLTAAVELRKIVVRGRTAARFLDACRHELRLSWKASSTRPKFEFGTGKLELANGRSIQVIAVNQFQNLPKDIAPELLELINQ